MLQKASTRGMRFLNFSQDFGSGFYTEREENTSTESIIFKWASVVAPLNLGTGRQRQKFFRLLSISDGFKVIAVCTGCDDHVKPMPPRFLDVEHVSPVLDV